MANKLIVSLSPHVHGGDSVQKNMYGVLIAFGACLAGVILYVRAGSCNRYADISHGVHIL